ncbi:hypothetical protein J7297_04610 [Nakaseomyces glabratus]|nr:hypothetical protein J7297_04610 [Nakaseomyces glabratus]
MVSLSGSGGKAKSADSVNKWRIPHYYKRGKSVGSTPVSEVVNSPLRAVQNEPSVSSPKKILLEERNRATPRSRKSSKKGQMVFVNYTVQDDDETGDKVDDDKADDVADVVPKTSAVTQAAILDNKHVLTSKRKSSRRRMLKIFGSSKEQVIPLEPESHQDAQKDLAARLIENSAESSSNTSNTSSSSSTPNSQGRSYGSFLKYNKFCSGSDRSKNNNASTDFNAMLINNQNKMSNHLALNYSAAKSAESLLNHFAEDEMVPKSLPDPNLAKPAIRVGPTDRKRSVSSSAIPMKAASSTSLTSKVTKPARKMSTTTTLSNPSSHNTPFTEFENSNLTDSYQYSDPYISRNSNMSNASITSFISSMNVGNSTNITPLTESTKVDTNDNFNALMKGHVSEPGEENDASVAFTKLFHRKRANTGGSTSSSNSNTTFQNSTQNITKSGVSKISAHRTTSLNSLASIANRFSPIRTASPVRPRSNTRSSSTCRHSRDLSGLVPLTTPEYLGPSTGTEVYLDTQSKRTVNHKKKQESISELSKFQNTPTSNNHHTANLATTPSSFLGTSYFANHPGQQTSYSNTSTPAATDINSLSTTYFSGKTAVGNSRQTSDISYMTEKEFHTDSEPFDTNDVPTPIEGVSSMRGISNNAIQELDEEERPNEDSSDTRKSEIDLMRLLDTNISDRKLAVNNNTKHFDDNDFNRSANSGGTRSNTAMDSFMTNFLYETQIDDTNETQQNNNDNSIFEDFDYKSLGLDNMAPNNRQILNDDCEMETKGTQGQLSSNFDFNFDTDLPIGHEFLPDSLASGQNPDQNHAAYGSRGYQIPDHQVMNNQNAQTDTTFKTLSNDLYYGN